MVWKEREISQLSIIEKIWYKDALVRIIFLLVSSISLENKTHGNINHSLAKHGISFHLVLE